MGLLSSGPLATQLQQQASLVQQQHLAELFEQDPQRFNTMHLRLPALLLDFSKQRMTVEAWQGLYRLCDESALAPWIAKLFQGEAVNTSEKRPALHMALRSFDQPFVVNGQDLQPLVEAQLAKMETLVERIHQRQWRGFSGRAITDVVNLGVGGSDLGPMMACHALEEFRVSQAKSLRIHFASSMDGSQLAELLQRLHPETTLFILASKSFTTIDTLSNADTALRWLGQACQDEALLKRQHFIGCSAAPAKMSQWGISKDHQLEFWDWVGGRYSLWSVIGMSIALVVGMSGFRQFLKGAQWLDQHFARAPWAENAPVRMALVDVWNTNFLASQTHAILPYDGRLKYLPAYLSQLEMESNGKRADRQGQEVDYPTCPILWGEVGTNAQHAFFQLLHQGTHQVNCDFVMPVQRYQHSHWSEQTRERLQYQQRLNLANCLAQSRVLMLGNQALGNQQQVDADRHYPGNQPSTTLLIEALTPYTLGQLIALYEHKVYTSAVLWNINPFDQWGVELGKQIAKETLAAIEGQGSGFDPSTEGLLAAVRAYQETQA